MEPNVLQCNKSGQRSLIVMVESEAASCCYYEHPGHFRKEGKFIPEAILESAIELAMRDSLNIYFIYGQRRPPLPIEQRIESIAHTKILPLRLREVYENGLFIIDHNDYRDFDRMKGCVVEHAILRVRRDDLNTLATIVASLTRARRLELVLLNLTGYKKSDFEIYALQLDKLKDVIVKRFKKDAPLELDILTDRLHLRAMRNCDAGSRHFTVAPDAKLYLCPGFFFDFPESGVDFAKMNARFAETALLSLDKAPICALCDAFHCRRCHYLNKSATMEINTPSQQQCVVSNLEQMCSAYLREEMLTFLANTSDLAPVSEPHCLDLLEFARANKNITLERYRRQS
jgi:CXXX repeat peptide maturase